MLPLDSPNHTDEELALLSHDDMGPALLAVSWIFVSLASIFLGLRVYCKLASRRGLWWDDWILIMAWATLLVDAALASHMVRHFTFGRHIWDFNPPSADEFALVSLVRVTFTIISIAWSKTAFAVTLLRITDGWAKTVVWGIILSMNTLMGLGGLFLWVECMPVEKVWKPSMQEGSCWNPGALIGYSIFASSYSVAMGFALAFLPWKVLYGLRMNMKEKIGIAVAMSMGVIGGIAGIVKTAKLPNIASPDIYYRADLAIWDITEAALIIIATCIPVLRILLREVGDNTYRQYESPRSIVNMQHIDIARVWSAGKGSLRKAVSFREVIHGEDNRSEHSGRSEQGGAVYVPAGRILRVDEVDINVHSNNNSTADIERQTPHPAAPRVPGKTGATGLSAAFSALGGEMTKSWTQWRQGRALRGS